MSGNVPSPAERLQKAADRIRKVADAANPGPWVYNSYSAIFSGPMMRTYDKWWDDTIPEGHTVERYGECPPCGDWKEFPCGIAPSPGLGHGCRYFTEDYRRDPLIATVPSHHGDTAIEKRAADAEHIELWAPPTAELVAVLLEGMAAHWAARPIADWNDYAITPLAALERHLNGEETSEQ
jgi:hypothetical protein